MKSSIKLKSDKSQVDKSKAEPQKKEVSFVPQNLEIYNKPPDEMRKIRIQIRKDKHKRFKEAYLEAKKAALNIDSHLYDSYDDESLTHQNDSPEHN
jgi:hypothetical protein